MKRTHAPWQGIRSVGVAMTLILILTAGVAGQRRGATPVAAPEPDPAAHRSIGDGVYSGAQAKRGRTLYLARCAGCHGEDLEGQGFAPGLAGAAFLSLWSGQTVQDLYSRTRTTMPEDMPGSLSPEETLDILAHVLQVNGFRPGAAELERADLEAIVIVEGKS